MKHKTIKNLIAVGLAAIFFISGGLSASAQTQMYRHHVQAGETLYQLSVKYGVSVESIQSANPALKEKGLQSNTVVLIPVVEHKDGIKGTNCRLMHKVKKKETLWGIAKQYGLTVEELLKANLDIENKEIKKGMFLCIPYASSELVAVQQEKAKGYEKLNVTLVLPLLNKKLEGERSVEFYRGFLMAVDEIKKKNIDIQVNAFDEPQSAQSFADVAAKIKATNPQMIIGPLYPQHFGDMTQLSKQLPDVKWVIPFSSKYEDLKTTSNVFLLNAPIEQKAQIVASLFAKTFKGAKAVFLHEGNGNEIIFSAAMRNALSQGGFDIVDLPAGYSADQLKALANGKKMVVFIPETSEENGVKNMIDKIKSLRQEYPKGRFALMAYPDWLDLPSISRRDLFDIDTYVFNNHFYNPYSVDTQKKVDEYSTWFKTRPLETSPRMFLLGYDAGIRLMTGLMNYGKDYAQQIIKTTALQHNISFIQVAPNSGYVNNSMYFIHYRTTGVIDLISDANYK